MTQNTIEENVANSKPAEVLARFAVTYQMCGDLEGNEWAELVLEHAKTNDLIKDYKVLSAIQGYFGIWYMIFSVDAKIFDGPYETAQEQALEIAAKIVGELDVNVFGIMAVND